MEECFGHHHMVIGTKLHIVLLVSYTIYGFSDEKEPETTKNITRPAYGGDMGY